MIDFGKYKNLNKRIANDLEIPKDEHIYLISSLLKNVTEAVINRLVKEEIIDAEIKIVEKAGNIVIEEFMNGLNKIL